MGRKRKAWSWSHGQYGHKVTIREPRPGAPLRWDYRDASGKRTRPEVHPRAFVRGAANEPVDNLLEQAAKDLCHAKVGELISATTGQTEKPAPAKRKALDPDALTVEGAFALHHEPSRKALPASTSARMHHMKGREFWTAKLGAKTLWNDVPPADIEGALKELVEDGQVATAVKRLQTLRTMARWLQRKMRIRGLEDPTIGVEAKDLCDGYTPRQPRLTLEQTRAMRTVVPTLNWRSKLFYTLLIPSGTRAIQARTAMRSMVDKKLEPPVPAGHAPHGWIALKPVKGQGAHVTYFTKRQRDLIESIIAGPLAKWEAQYQAKEIEDYPLLPSGRIDRDQLTMEPISDRIMRYELRAVFEAAGIPKQQGDRIGFHAVRRAWSDYMDDAIGSEAASSAGGWSDDEMLKNTYRSKLRHKHLEQARKVQESEDE